MIQEVLYIEGRIYKKKTSTQWITDLTNINVITNFCLKKKKDIIKSSTLPGCAEKRLQWYYSLPDGIPQAEMCNYLSVSMKKIKKKVTPHVTQILG